MIASLRRFRWLAALLTLLSPAVGGELLPLLHPCPVETPWRMAVEPAVVADEAHAHHHGAAPAEAPAAPSHEHGGDGSCSCLGDCQPPLLATPPAAVEIVASVATAPTFAPSAPEDAAPAPALILDRLPPTTAPPIA